MTMRGLSECSAFSYPHYGIVVALFLAGLIGSLSHCVGMCSPFVISQVANIGKMTRLRGLALLPYHSGRITTYVIFGVVASLLSSQVMALPVFKIFSMLLLVLAGVVFLLSAINHWGIIPLPSFMCGIPRWLSNLTKPLFLQPTGWRGYVLGVALGFMPCGLVFAAVMAVTATANPLLAALAMAGFGLGTVPVLLLVGFSSRLVLNRYKPWLQPFSAAMMMFNSFLLFFLAGGLT